MATQSTYYNPHTTFGDRARTRTLTATVCEGFGKIPGWIHWQTCGVVETCAPSKAEPEGKLGQQGRVSQIGSIMSSIVMLGTHKLY